MNYDDLLIGDLQAHAWTYAQKTGELQQDGKHVANGYSGADVGKNNPAMQQVPNVGPIPQGDWTISGPPADTQDHGRMSCISSLPRKRKPSAEADS